MIKIFFHLLQVLALNEFLELIVPLCYLFCFLVAFYGHNSHLVGQIVLMFQLSAVFYCC